MERAAVHSKLQKNRLHSCRNGPAYGHISCEGNPETIK